MCAVFSEAGEKAIHGAVDNVIHLICACVVLPVMNVRMRATGRVCELGHRVGSPR